MEGVGVVGNPNCTPNSRNIGERVAKKIRGERWSRDGQNRQSHTDIHTHVYVDENAHANHIAVVIYGALKGTSHFPRTSFFLFVLIRIKTILERKIYTVKNSRASVLQKSTL